MSHRVQSPHMLTPSMIHNFELKKIVERLADDQIFEANMEERIRAIGAQDREMWGLLRHGQEICDVTIPRHLSPVRLDEAERDAVAAYLLLAQRQAMEESFAGATDELNSSPEGSSKSFSPLLPLPFEIAAKKTEAFLQQELRKPLTNKELAKIECRSIGLVLEASSDAYLPLGERCSRERLSVSRSSNEAIMIRENEQSILFKQFLEERHLCLADVYLHSIQDRGFETLLWKEFKAYQKRFASPTQSQVFDPEAEAKRLQEINELLEEEDRSKKRASRCARPKPIRKNNKPESESRFSPQNRESRELLSSPPESKRSPRSPPIKAAKAAVTSNEVPLGVRYDRSEKGFREVRSPKRLPKSLVNPPSMIQNIFSEIRGSSFSIDDRVNRWFHVCDLNEIKQFPDLTSEHLPRYAKMNEGFLKEQLLRHQCPPAMACMLMSPLFREKYCITRGDSLFLKVKLRVEPVDLDQDFTIMSIGIDKGDERIFHSYIHAPSSLHYLNEQCPSPLADTRVQVTTTRVQINEEKAKIKEICLEGSSDPLIELPHTHPILGRIVLTFAPIGPTYTNRSK